MRVDTRPAVSDVVDEAIAAYLDEHDGERQSAHDRAPLVVQNVNRLRLYGASSKARRASAQIIVTAAERRGQSPDPWAVEVAAGRIGT